MSKQVQTAAGGALSLERLVFFSDAVFAIAITLLVLEIEVPHVRPGSGEFAHALRELLPQFFAFVLSFMVIGRFWISHHQMMDDVRTFHFGLMWPNLLLLMAIAFMPFSTALLGANLTQFGPVLFYNLTLLVVALLGLHLVRRIEKLGVAGASIQRDRQGAVAVVIGAALSVLIGLFAPAPSQLGMATIPFTIRLFARRSAKAAKA